MVADRLTCHHMPVTTVEKLWHRIEAAWSSVPVHTIQCLFDSMPRHISVVITARECGRGSRLIMIANLSPPLSSLGFESRVPTEISLVDGLIYKR
ncbi:hypothetical protein TNCV_1909381 [Trichonephila clavipes]|nr:hypothetical protein TNCV_1909381 [Trichonephila clavipes]